LASQASQAVDNAETEIISSKNSQEGEIPQTKKKVILRQNSNRLSQAEPEERKRDEKGPSAQKPRFAQRRKRVEMDTHEERKHPKIIAITFFCQLIK